MYNASTASEARARYCKIQSRLLTGHTRVLEPAASRRGAPSKNWQKLGACDLSLDRNNTRFSKRSLLRTAPDLGPKQTLGPFWPHRPPAGGARACNFTRAPCFQALAKSPPSGPAKIVTGLGGPPAIGHSNSRAGKTLPNRPAKILWGGQLQNCATKERFAQNRQTGINRPGDDGIPAAIIDTLSKSQWGSSRASPRTSSECRRQEAPQLRGGLICPTHRHRALKESLSRGRITGAGCAPEGAPSGRPSEPPTMTP